MRRSTRAITAALSVLALGAAVAACTDDSGSGASSTSEGSVSGPDNRLTVLSEGPVQAWDPQRITDRRTAGFASRTWMRTLTAYTPDSALAGQRTLTGDLARDTGRPNEDASVWTFSLRAGVTWQDGSAVTCEDVRHGVARSFDEKVPSSGYALTYLDIPKTSDGTSRYPGPSAKGGDSWSATQLLEDAVECKDSTTVVFHLAEPVGNFDEIVSLPEFAPFKEAKDDGKGTYRAYSTGPYKLKDGWTSATGGTWVRNPEWARWSDPLRRAGPTSIRHEEGVEPKDALNEIIEGEDGGRTLALDPLPASLAPALDEAGEVAQSVETDGQLVDYLAVNAESTALRSQHARQAFASATDREAYVKGVGDGAPAWSLLGTALPSAHETVLDHGPTGDPAAAKKQLKEASVSTPISVRLAHRDDEATAEALEALLPRWEEAGFDVTLEPVEGEDYFTEVSDRTEAEKYDVLWANWGPDHPSAATVLPPLFDDRINLTKSSVGRNHGLFADEEVTADMDDAAETRDREDRAKKWSRIDTELLTKGAYVPLRQSRLTYAAGSEVTSLVGNPVHGGAPEMGLIGVER